MQVIGITLLSGPSPKTCRNMRGPQGKNFCGTCGGQRILSRTTQQANYHALFTPEQAMSMLARNLRQIFGAKPLEGKRTRFTIEGVRGLILDVFTTGRRVWYVRYDVGRGKLRRSRSFRIGNASHVGLSDAIDKSRKLMAGVEVEGIDPQLRKRLDTATDDHIKLGKPGRMLSLASRCLHVRALALNHSSQNRGVTDVVYNRYGYDKEKLEAFERWEASRQTTAGPSHLMACAGTRRLTIHASSISTVARVRCTRHRSQAARIGSQSPM